MCCRKLSPNQRTPKQGPDYGRKLLCKTFQIFQDDQSATSGSESTLHVSKQVVGLKIPDKSTIDHSFHGLVGATCQSNRAIEVKEKHQGDASIADSVSHLVLLKYHGLYVDHPATLLKRRACCIPQHFQMKS